MKTHINNHRHTWIVVSSATILAIVFLIWFPHQKPITTLFMGIAGGHLIIALIALFTGWLVIPQTIFNKLFKRKTINGFDFGWSPKWIYGFLLASVIVFAIAVHVYFALTGWPVIQLIVYTLLLLFALNLFIGNVIIQNSNRTRQITLPMVNILKNGGNSILDAGCGAGRTTIAIAQALPNAIITAFDRFDADYIDNGGLDLITKNIELAGIKDRVKIAKGDIINPPFNDNEFDAIVSSFMMDHLPSGKKQALKESYRIMKPGGRFLLIIVVRGYSAFGVASFLSLFLTSNDKWIKWIEQTGFTMVCDGKINEGAYFCFEKPLNNK